MIRFLLPLALMVTACLHGQRQYSDTLYLPPTFTPRYVEGSGPLVYIDETHNNFHTRNGRYRPFTNVLLKDGFQVASFTGTTDEIGLKEVEILVIANALPNSSLERWEAPTASAFTADEITALLSWVDKGGCLFLIADHMPMGGAAKELAAAFGFTFFDSFANNERTAGGIEIFKLEDGSLQPSLLTTGKDGYFDVEHVATFTGQAFQIPKDATEILHCGPGWVSRFPETAWQFTEDTKEVDSDGWSQGAYLHVGKGKIVCFGEAAMFSAQIVEIDDQTYKAGMNESENAKYNYRLLLNIMRWLGEK